METSGDNAFLFLAQLYCTAVFSAEAALRIMAEGRKPWRYVQGEHGLFNLYGEWSTGFKAA